MSQSSGSQSETHIRTVKQPINQNRHDFVHSTENAKTINSCPHSVWLQVRSVQTERARVMRTLAEREQQLLECPERGCEINESVVKATGRCTVEQVGNMLSVSLSTEWLVNLISPLHTALCSPSVPACVSPSPIQLILLHAAGIAHSLCFFPLLLRADSCVQTLGEWLKERTQLHQKSGLQLADLRDSHATLEVSKQTERAALPRLEQSVAAIEGISNWCGNRIRWVGRCCLDNLRFEWSHCHIIDGVMVPLPLWQSAGMANTAPQPCLFTLTQSHTPYHLYLLL